MVTFLRFCLLLISVTGYLWYFTQKFKIKLAFAPALFCAGASNLLFVGGILNILPETAWLLFAGGFILLALSFKNKFRLCGREVILSVLFLFILIYFFWVMRGAHYTSYDNFSHWATVVKDMLLEDRMPNFKDTVIRFQSYPLGSSLFIYYVCKAIGTADGCLLFAQVFMLVSFLFCMAAFIGRKNWYWAFVAVLFGIWALTVNNSIYELRVDTLLPLAAVAAFAVISGYRHEPWKALHCSSGLFVLLVNMKNSGIFFYAVCVAFLTACAWRDFRKHKLRYFNAALFLPILAMFLWKKHVAYGFWEGMESKHAMSLENYGQVFAKKSGSDIAQIGLNMLRRFTGFGNAGMGMEMSAEMGIAVKMMLIMTIFLAVLVVFLRIQQERGQTFASHIQQGRSQASVSDSQWSQRQASVSDSQWSQRQASVSGRQQRKNQATALLRVVLAAWGCLAAYTASVYGMYVFSMPLGEAVNLASYDRYMLTVFIFIYGMMLISFMDFAGIAWNGKPVFVGIAWNGKPAFVGITWNGKPVLAGAAVAAMLFMMLLWPARERLPLLCQKPDFTGTKRHSLQQMMEQSGMGAGDSCFIYCNGTDDAARYLFYLARYEFWSADVLVAREADFAEKRQEIEDYDYFIIWDSDGNTDQYLEERGFGQYLGEGRIAIQCCLLSDKGYWTAPK